MTRYTVVVSYSKVLPEEDKKQYMLSVPKNCSTPSIGVVEADMVEAEVVVPGGRKDMVAVALVLAQAAVGVVIKVGAMDMVAADEASAAMDEAGDTEITNIIPR